MLRLRLLGVPSISDGAREIHLSSQKAQALLFYLATEAERSFSRSQVIALLWEESSEREGRNSLSTVLSRLRQTLPIAPLRAEGDTLTWQPSNDVWVDLHEFQTLSDHLGPATDEWAAGPERHIQQLEASAELYRGSFLDGFNIRDSESYNEWLRLERERWQQRWLAILTQLVDAYTAIGEWPCAIDHARRALASNPLQERFHRALMRLHHYTGDRTAALAQFRICSEVLARELGIEPDAETIELQQQIITGKLDRAQRPAADAAFPQASHSPRPAPKQPAPFASRATSALQHNFVGRTDELALFTTILAAEEPPFAILRVQGPGGVGKSALLNEFARRCADSGVSALLLDGRDIQPTPNGFLKALCELTGAARPLDALPERTVMLIDSYELLAPLDHWLRDQFLPQMPYWSLVVLADRNPPSSGWRVDPAWQEMTRVIQLGNFRPAEVADYLERRGLPSEQANMLLRCTHGHPLALSLASQALIQRPSSNFDGVAAPNAVPVLIERFVAGAPSASHRAALEACCQVRVMTEPLLAAMLGLPEARTLFAWLRGLSFISAGPGCLFPHDLLRAALSAELKRHNPSWRLELQRRAHHFYIRELERAPEQPRQLTLLDIGFLHDNPLDARASTGTVSPTWSKTCHSRSADRRSSPWCGAAKALGRQRSLYASLRGFRKN